MGTRLSAYALAAISLAACGTAVEAPRVSDDWELSHDAVTVVQADGELLAAAPLFGRVQGAVISGGLLWISDASGDPYLHAVDPIDGRLLVSRGRQGDGPGDFRQINDLLPSRSTNDVDRVVAFDNVQNRLTTVSRDSAVPPTTMQVPVAPRIRRLARMGSDYIGWSTSRFVRIDSGGRLVDTSAAVFLLGADSVDLRQRHAATAQLRVCSQPSGQRFAVAYQAAGRLEIRDATSRLLALARTPYPSDALFLADEQGAVKWRADRFNYLHCIATDSVIVALFSGRAVRQGVVDSLGADASHGRFIHVFSWDGAQEQIVELDRAVTRIALTPAGDAVIGTATNESAVYRFKLPRSVR